MLSPQSARLIRHFGVYLCDSLNLTGHPDIGAGLECGDISGEVEPCRFTTVIAAWTVGGNVSNKQLGLRELCGNNFGNFDVA